MEKPILRIMVFPQFLFKVHMGEFCMHNVLVCCTQFGKTKPYYAILYGQSKSEKIGNSTRYMKFYMHVEHGQFYM